MGQLTLFGVLSLWGCTQVGSNCQGSLCFPGSHLSRVWADLLLVMVEAGLWPIRLPSVLPAFRVGGSAASGRQLMGLPDFLLCGPLCKIKSGQPLPQDKHVTNLPPASSWAYCSTAVVLSMIKRKEERCAIRLRKKDALLTAPAALGHFILNVRKPEGNMQPNPIHVMSSQPRPRPHG